MVVECNICGKKFENNKQLWGHSSKVHKETQGEHPQSYSKEDEKYIRENWKEMSDSEIAKKLGKSAHMIQQKRMRMNLVNEDSSIHIWKENKKNEKYKEEEFLKKEYTENNKCLEEIADMCGVSGGTIRTYLKKYDITIRKPVQRGNHLNLSEEVINFIEGALLGDGSVSTNGISGMFRYTDSEIEVVEWVSEKLSELDIKQTGKIYENKIGSYLYSSKSYRELKRIRDKWYPNDKKTIPSDLEINPTKLLLSYIGDGTYYLNDGKRSCKIGSTQTSKNLSIITTQLNNIGIKCKPNQGGIYIWRESMTDFFDYILQSPYRPPCYKYKFPEDLRNEFNRK